MPIQSYKEKGAVLRPRQMGGWGLEGFEEGVDRVRVIPVAIAIGEFVV